MTDGEVLLAVLVLIGLFVVYELLGVDARFSRFHTISYYAQRHRWLAVLIGLLFLLGGGVGLIWWIRHLTSAVIQK